MCFLKQPGFVNKKPGFVLKQHHLVFKYHEFVLKYIGIHDDDDSNWMAFLTVLIVSPFYAIMSALTNGGEPICVTFVIVTMFFFLCEHIIRV